MQNYTNVGGTLYPTVTSFPRILPVTPGAVERIPGDPIDLAARLRLHFGQTYALSLVNNFSDVGEANSTAPSFPRDPWGWRANSH